MSSLSSQKTKKGREGERREFSQLSLPLTFPIFRGWLYILNNKNETTYCDVRNAFVVIKMQKAWENAYIFIRDIEFHSHKQPATIFI